MKLRTLVGLGVGYAVGSQLGPDRIQRMIGAVVDQLVPEQLVERASEHSALGAIRGDSGAMTSSHSSNGSALAERRAPLRPGTNVDSRRRRPSGRDLRSMSDVELYLLAKDRGVEGRADLSRDELLSQLTHTS